MGARNSGSGVQRLRAVGCGERADRRLLFSADFWNSGVSQLPSAGGDLSGTLTGATVTRIQNRPVGSTVPAAGQALVWDGSQWSPQLVGGTVSTVFGRVGVVTAQAGDYTFSQIGGTV